MFMESIKPETAAHKPSSELNTWTDENFVGHISNSEQRKLDSRNAAKIVANALASNYTDTGILIGKNACADSDPEAFFPNGNSRSVERDTKAKEAKPICARCVVRATCLYIAINSGEEFGIWGGRDEIERDRIRSRVPSERSRLRLRSQRA